jgi:hypothetical protein
MRTLLLLIALICIQATAQEKEYIYFSGKIEITPQIRYIDSVIYHVKDSTVIRIKDSIRFIDLKEEILFVQDFNDNTPGPYLRSEFEKDFPAIQGVTDPRPLYWDSPSFINSLGKRVQAGKLLILQENSNKFIRHEIKAGESSSSYDHGMLWYQDIKDCDEAWFSFKVRFDSAFFTSGKFVSGKIHGLYNPYDGDAGQRPGANTGFSASIMFQNSSKYDSLWLHSYIYHQNMPWNDCKCWTKDWKCPYDSCKVYWGEGQDVGSSFKPNKWYTVLEHVKLNDPYENNGIVEFYIDGKLISFRNNYRFRDTEAVKIEQLKISNFMSSPANKDTYVDFDDFKVITK